MYLSWTNVAANIAVAAAAELATVQDGPRKYTQAAPAVICNSEQEQADRPYG